MIFRGRANLLIYVRRNFLRKFFLRFVCQLREVFLRGESPQDVVRISKEIRRVPDGTKHLNSITIVILLWTLYLQN